MVLGHQRMVVNSPRIGRMQPNSKARPPACQTHTSKRLRSGATLIPVQMQSRVAPWIGRPLESWPDRCRDHDVPEHPQLLISDIELPDGSGLELMWKLRSKDALKGIALSGFG